MLVDVLGSGLTIGNVQLFSARNIMGFINDLAGQIEDLYANDPERVKSLLKKAIDKVAFMQVSSVASTKFLDSPGFGDAGRGGNFEEFGMSLGPICSEGTRICPTTRLWRMFLNNLKTAILLRYL